MKALSLITLLSSFVAFPQSALPQALQTSPRTSAEKSGKTVQSVLTTSVRTRKSDSDLLRKQVTFTGFMVDAAKTNSLSRMLSLRRPVDPKRDGENVINDPVTGRIAGVRFLSINF